MTGKQEQEITLGLSDIIITRSSVLIPLSLIITWHCMVLLGRCLLYFAASAGWLHYSSMTGMLSGSTWSRSFFSRLCCMFFIWLSWNFIVDLRSKDSCALLLTRTWLKMKNNLSWEKDYKCNGSGDLGNHNWKCVIFMLTFWRRKLSTRNTRITMLMNRWMVRIL